jgi:hypothetical protein
MLAPSFIGMFLIPPKRKCRLPWLNGRKQGFVI